MANLGPIKIYHTTKRGGSAVRSVSTIAEAEEKMRSLFSQGLHARAERAGKLIGEVDPKEEWGWWLDTYDGEVVGPNNSYQKAKEWAHAWMEKVPAGKDVQHILTYTGKTRVSPKINKALEFIKSTFPHIWGIIRTDRVFVKPMKTPFKGPAAQYRVGTGQITLYQPTIGAVSTAFYVNSLVHEAIHGYETRKGKLDTGRKRATHLGDLAMERYEREHPEDAKATERYEDLPQRIDEAQYDRDVVETNLYIKRMEKKYSTTDRSDLFQKMSRDERIALFDLETKIYYPPTLQKSNPHPPHDLKALLKAAPNLHHKTEHQKAGLTRDYWDTHLENNPLRIGDIETNAAAWLSYYIEAGGDILRELAANRDAHYYGEKITRIKKSLPYLRDWSDRLNPDEIERLNQTKRLLENMPVYTDEMVVAKELIRSIMERDVRQIATNLSLLEATIT